MRGFVTSLMLLVGLSLAGASYIFLAAPLGPPISPVYSNPRLLGAPAVFILGIILVFLSAVAYELIPERAPSRLEVPTPTPAFAGVGRHGFRFRGWRSRAGS